MPKNTLPVDRGVVGEAERITKSLLRALKASGPPSDEAPDAVLLEDCLRKAAALVEELGGLGPALRDKARGATEDAERQFLELEATVRERCGARGWKVDGQWPTLHVERAVTVEFDSKNRTIAVAGKRVPGSSAGAVVMALEPIVDRLLPKGFSPKVFLEDLVASYDAVTGGARQASILEVYRELVVRSQDSRFWRDARSETFRGMSADQFRARLARALEDNILTTTDGRGLRVLPPLNAKDGMFIYQPAESRFGFVGRIDFTRPEHPENP